MNTKEKLEAIYAHEEIHYILLKLGEVMVDHADSVAHIGNIKQSNNILFLANLLVDVSYYFSLNTRTADSEDIIDIVEGLKSDLDGYILEEMP